MIESIAKLAQEGIKEIGKEVSREIAKDFPKNLQEMDINNFDSRKENEKIEPKGGAYNDLPTKEGYEKHHMPADSTTDIPFREGPCINMEKEDHRQTASCGNSKEAQEYRAMQQELINQGKFDEALQMDIDDIREKFGNKYDDAITELQKYVEELKQGGKI